MDCHGDNNFESLSRALPPSMTATVAVKAMPRAKLATGMNELLTDSPSLPLENSAKEEPNDNDDPSSLSSKTLLVLYSTTCPHRLAKSHQHQAFQLLDSLIIPYTMLDGADADCRTTRDDLFVLSGRHASYPQFFIMTGDSDVFFWGDWERFHQAHERGDLVQELFGDEKDGYSCNDMIRQEEEQRLLLLKDQLVHQSELSDKTSNTPTSSSTVETNDSSSSSEEDIDILLHLDSSFESADAALSMEEMSPDLSAPLPVTQLGKGQSSKADAPVDRSQDAPRETLSDSLSLGGTKELGSSSSAPQESIQSARATRSAKEDVFSTDSKSDITIYGATSFVAQNHVLPYLMQVSLHLPLKVLHITLAGRSRSKLQALQDDVSRKMQNLVTVHETSASAKCVFDIYVADGADEAALLDMAITTRCVLNCSGPFRRYSSLVVGACARAGTDYVDITGEVSWASEMRQRYGPTAQSSGARIISFCGFDSIPSDLAVFAGVEALRTARHKKHDTTASHASNAASVEIETATTWHYCVGMANGGTIHTVLDMPVKLDSLMHPVPYLMDDPLALTHPSVRQDLTSQPMRNRLALAEWRNQLPTFDSIFMLGVSIPFFMAVANAKIVHASSVALKYGSKFAYRERFVPVGFAFTTNLGPLSIIPAIITYASLILGIVVLKLPFLGSRLATWLAPPGTGLTDEACRRGKTEVYVLVESAKDKDGCNDRASVTLKFKGDPGNLVTAQCIAESALCLVLDRNKLPPNSLDGFGTPAELMGHALLSRLQTTSVRPVTFSTTVRQKVSGRDWTMY